MRQLVSSITLVCYIKGKPVQMTIDHESSEGNYPLGKGDMGWLVTTRLSTQMEQQIHEFLELRATRRRKGLHANVMRYSTCMPESTGNPIDLTRLQCVTSRPGFLRLQQKNPSLTPLKRLHVELQLLAREHEPALDTHEDDGVEAQSSALERCLVALSQDRLCFDVTYTSYTRTADTKETLFDGRDELKLKLTGAVAFSSTRGGATARITVFTVEEHDDLFTKSSLHPPDKMKSVEWVHGARPAIDLIWSL